MKRDLNAFLQAQQTIAEGRQRLEVELKRLHLQHAVDPQRHELRRERIVGPVPSAVAGHFKDRVIDLHKFYPHPA